LTSKVELESSIGFLDEVKVRKTHFSKHALRTDLGSLDELMASIEKIGLLQPIVVRPVSDGFEVVAGNRRFEACRRLGWIKIPCHIVELDDREAFEVSLVENVQRKSLDPIEEARAFKRYVEDFGWGGVSDLARRIGKSQVYVSKRIKLLTLPKEVQDEIAEGHISPSVGEELLYLNDEYQQTELGIRAAKERLSKEEVRSLVKLAREGRVADEDTFIESVPYSYSELERRQRVTDRAIAKSIAALKIALMRIDDAIDSVEEGWVIRELLMEHRRAIHSHISALLNLRKRLSRRPPMFV